MGLWTGWRGVMRTNEYPPHRGFWCPACETLHVFDERWTFDGNYDRPTFTPSLRTSTGHYVSGIQRQPDGKCGICENARERGVRSICGECHLNVTAGQIFYHGDSTHGWGGKTVSMIAKEEPTMVETPDPAAPPADQSQDKARTPAVPEADRPAHAHIWAPTPQLDGYACTFCGERKPE